MSVIEFGPGRFGPLGRLGRDRRIAPLAAGLGAVALFASLIAEWQVTRIDATELRESNVGNRPFESSIGDLGGWGAGYLAGLFVLVVAVALLLFGPVPGRAYARLATLGSGGVLLAVVVAAFSTLDRTSFVLRQVELASFNDDQFSISIGRGPWCAGAGVLLILLAAYLAPFAVAGHPVLVEAAVIEDDPLDLTVTPAAPVYRGEMGTGTPVV
ncbi:hypothetical protein GCM10010435_63330 [Winogradskya consettensis]|uniref:Uncharacterized protein n=1 Tax=Winogradskya consettensis TaxID=113560 RepID=A0A919VYV4_9ACTN|nr:hypothetical protein [Actinoplanes consettensis]GIM74053.1 hypothetical protein Aco04nite_38400 [Actinoplanes consettensis]